MIEISESNVVDVLSQVSRDLTVSQRAAIGSEWIPILRKECQRRRGYLKQNYGESDARKLIAELLGISRSSVQHADEVRRCDVPLFNELKSGTLTLLAAQTKLGFPRRRHAQKRKYPLGTRESRARRIHALAAEGHLAAQIAEIAELHEATVRRIATDYGISLPDDHPGRANGGFDVNRLVDQAVLDLGKMSLYLDLMREHANYIDISLVPAWMEEIEKSRRAVREIVAIFKRKGGL